MNLGFTDPNNIPADSLAAVKISTLPSSGTFADNGTPVTANQFISVADLVGDKLVFTPAAHVFGTNYGNFTFQVQDNGSTLNGGANLDPNPKLLEIDVAFVNHAPSGSSNILTTLQDTALTLQTSNFGFSDPNNIPSNSLKAVKFTTVPGAAVISDNGSAVTAGQFSDLKHRRLVQRRQPYSALESAQCARQHMLTLYNRGYERL